MSTVIGSIIGFIAALIPPLFNYYFKLQPTTPEPTAHAGSVTDGSTSIVQPKHTHLDWYRATVRPTITYLFFGLFSYLKLTALHHALNVDKTPVVSLLPVVWDENSALMFSAVLAFWFGSRAIQKLTR